VCRRCEHGIYAHAVLHGCFPSRGQAVAYASGLWIHRFPLGLERRVAVFVAPSAYMAGQLRRWGIADERIAVVPNFTPLRHDASTEPGTYGLYVGRLAAEKGLDVLLQALAMAGDPPFRVLGRGPSEAELRRRADRLGLRNTEFMGHLGRTEVDEVLKGARFVALPSSSAENAPLAALEAMAAGRPLVVSTMGGLPELIEGGAGLSCSAGDVAGLADRMTQLFRDDRHCRESGARALAYAESSFGPDLHRRRLEDVYVRAARARTVAGAGG
jgi:glycosyltransferase involved in cell wall biosynthesis